MISRIWFFTWLQASFLILGPTNLTQMIEKLIYTTSSFTRLILVSLHSEEYDSFQLSHKILFLSPSSRYDAKDRVFNFQVLRCDPRKQKFENFSPNSNCSSLKSHVNLTTLTTETSSWKSWDHFHKIRYTQIYQFHIPKV